jgi:hypothetical protein
MYVHTTPKIIMPTMIIVPAYEGGGVDGDPLSASFVDMRGLH